jgi:hypothetical protein
MMWILYFRFGDGHFVYSLFYVKVLSLPHPKVSIRLPSINLNEYKELSIILYIKRKGGSDKGSDRLVKYDYRSSCFYLGFAKENIGIGRCQNIRYGNSRTRISFYISPELKWKKSWNEIIMLISPSNDRYRAPIITYFNGARADLLYTGPGIPSRNHGAKLMLYLGSPLGFKSFVGWLANVMIIASILRKNDIAEHNCKWKYIIDLFL